MWHPASTGSILSPRLQELLWQQPSWLPSSTAPVQILSWHPVLPTGAVHAVSLILNYRARCKTGFCTHTLMCTKADTSGKFPVCSGCAAEYIECEHRADLASAWLHPDNLPGSSSCKVWGTPTWLIMMFCRLRFYQWTVKGLSLGFHIFTRIILICVILLASEEYLCFYG